MALTLRLADEEVDELERLKHHLNIKSSSKIISYLITDYISKDEILNKTRFNLAQTEHRIKTLLSLVREKQEMETKIQDFLESE